MKITRKQIKPITEKQIKAVTEEMNIIIRKIENGHKKAATSKLVFK